MGGLSSAEQARAIATVSARLREAGCLAAEDEARELLAASAGGPHLSELVARRVAGEPLAWIVGQATFCGITVRVDHGVYVPRWQSEVLAERAASLLPARGVGLDLCCGCGAIAALMARRRPGARVVGVDIDPRAVRCAARNGVEAVAGDLFDALPHTLRGAADVVVAVAPYVPTDHLSLLARTHEPRAALDGGGDGLDVVRRVIAVAPRWLRPGGALLVEVGEPQLPAVRRLLADAGFERAEVLRDLDGDVCGLAAHVRSRR